MFIQWVQLLCRSRPQNLAKQHHPPAIEPTPVLACSVFSHTCEKSLQGIFTTNCVIPTPNQQHALFHSKMIYLFPPPHPQIQPTQATRARQQLFRLETAEPAKLHQQYLPPEPQPQIEPDVLCPASRTMSFLDPAKGYLANHPLNPLHECRKNAPDSVCSFVLTSAPP